MENIKNSLVAGFIGVIVGILAILGVVGIVMFNDKENIAIDADGDGWSDAWELERFDPMLNSFRYNPEVSDLPIIDITIAAEPIVSIDYEVSNTETNETSYFSSSTSTRNTTTNESWTESSQLEIGVSGGWDLSKGGAYAEVNETLTLSNSYTYSLQEMIENSNTYSKNYTNTQGQTITTKGAKVVCPVYIKNVGNMPVNLTGLTLTAYVEDWYGGMNVIGTLEHDGGTFPEINLPANSNSVLINFKNDTLYPSDIARIFYNAKKIRVVVASVNSEIDEGNFNTLYSSMLSKTARVNVFHTEVSANKSLNVVVKNNDTLLEVVDRLGLEREWQDNNHGEWIHILDGERGNEMLDGNTWALNHNGFRSSKSFNNNYNVLNTVGFEDIKIKVGDTLTFYKAPILSDSFVNQTQIVAWDHLLDENKIKVSDIKADGYTIYKRIKLLDMSSRSYTNNDLFYNEEESYWRFKHNIYRSFIFKAPSEETETIRFEFRDINSPRWISVNSVDEYSRNDVVTSEGLSYIDIKYYPGIIIELVTVTSRDDYSDDGDSMPIWSKQVEKYEFR